MWCYQMETFSVLPALREGNPPVTDGFPWQRPVTQSFDVFFYLRLNKRLNKQSRHQWFETQSRSVTVIIVYRISQGRGRSDSYICAHHFTMLWLFLNNERIMVRLIGSWNVVTEDPLMSFYGIVSPQFTAFAHRVYQLFENGLSMKWNKLCWNNPIAVSRFAFVHYHLRFIDPVSSWHSRANSPA